MYAHVTYNVVSPKRSAKGSNHKEDDRAVPIQNLLPMWLNPTVQYLSNSLLPPSSLSGRTFNFLAFTQWQRPSASRDPRSWYMGHSIRTVGISTMFSRCDDAKNDNIQNYGFQTRKKKIWGKNGFQQSIYVTSDMFWSTVFEFRSSSRAAPAQYYFIACIQTIQRCHLFLKNNKFLKNQQSPWAKKFN